MKLPRFTAGRIGLLDYKALNQAFTAIEELKRDTATNATKPSEIAGRSFVAQITGLTTSATQGSNQGTASTETVVGATFVQAYLYDWVEVSIGCGDGIAPVGTGVSVLDLSCARGTELSAALSTTYYPAVDFNAMQRYTSGDLVLLSRIAVRSGSRYSTMYAVSPLQNASTAFLARLTSGHATIAGLYAWTGVSVQLSGSTLGKSLAVNLFELNAVRSCENYANVLTMNGTSYAGSSNWGHGQDTTAISKLPLPTGSAGTGTIVQMNRGALSATLTTTTAGSFVVGIVYKIITVGTTNWTLIGASASTVGISFTATGIGTGTGTAGFFGAHYWFYSVAPVTCV